MPEPVGDLSGGDEEGGEHDRVGVEDPRQRRRRCARERRRRCRGTRRTGSSCRGTWRGLPATPPPTSPSRGDRIRGWAPGRRAWTSWSSGHHGRPSSIMQLISDLGVPVSRPGWGCGRRASRSEPGRRRTPARPRPSPEIASRSLASSIARCAPTRNACLHRVVVPLHVVVGAVRVERQHQPFACRAELARCAVEGRERDALDRGVEAVARERIGRRGARVLGDELAGVGAVAPRTRSRPSATTPSAPSPTADHGVEPGDHARAGGGRRRTTNHAGMAASAASTAAITKAGRNERGDGVGHRVHQFVAGTGHRVVALGAAVVELGGEVGHLPAVPPRSRCAAPT